MTHSQTTVASFLQNWIGRRQCRIYHLCINDWNIHFFRKSV